MVNRLRRGQEKKTRSERSSLRGCQNQMKERMTERRDAKNGYLDSRLFQASFAILNKVHFMDSSRRCSVTDEIGIMVLEAISF